MKDYSLDDYWQYLHDFFASKRGTVIINVVKGHVYNHWTMAYRISGKSLFLLDSEGMKRITKRHCTIDVEQQHLIWLNPPRQFLRLERHC